MAQNPTFNPAATFNLITNANTFADWVTTTNSLVQQNNDLAANNFYKSTGTLYLNDPNLALQTNSTAQFSGTTYLSTAVVGTLRTTGTLVLSGNTTYQSNNFVINANSIYNLNGSYGVFRPYGVTAKIRWNEGSQFWDVLDVNNTNQATAYSQILTANMISSSLVSTSTVSLATSNAVNQLYNMVTSTSAGASNTFITTSGSANPVNGVISLKSNNGIAISGSSNNVFLNLPQTLANTSTPTFASLNLAAPLAITQGGTGANTFLGALNNLLPPTGQISGYVLTTTGAGQYYWGVGGGGAGGAGGNIITTNRKYYTAVGGQSVFTGTPTYTIGSGQLRLYINGVRQYGSEYTEVSNTSFSLSVPSTPGDLILVEVDAYTSAFFANNTAYAANTTYLSNAQNTVQLGIDGALGFTKSAYDLSNTTVVVANTMYRSQNTTGVYANAAYTQANAAIGLVSNLSSTLANTFTSNLVSVNVFTANTISTNTITSNVLNSIATSSTGLATMNLASIQTATVTAATITTANVTGFATIAAANVTGSAVISSLGVGTTASGTSGEIRATNNITAYYSDDNLKDRLGNIENALDKLMTLNGFYYQANQTAQDFGYAVKREVGVSAQEVQRIMPEVVVPAPISDKYLTVHYERLIPLLVEAIKELKTEVNEIRGLIK